MTVFSDKLDGLTSTVELAVAADVAQVADGLCAGRDGLALAVGSGGSAVAAEYLAVCRNGLQAAPTLVRTPLEFALGEEDVTQAQIWLFSARGENSDMIGAIRAAAARRAGAIHVVTANEDGRLACEASALANARVHVLPIADPKDGFLATHSLVATVVALLRAADRCSGASMEDVLDDGILAAARVRLASENRACLASEFASLACTDTLILLVDPRLTPAAVTVETSAWEAAICPVQRTDFRNFAHGRHVWLARRSKETVILSLTGTDTRDAWLEIQALIPSHVRSVRRDYANCGRFQNALGVLDGLGIVEAMGRAGGVDPGRPGIGSFGRGLYEGTALERLTARLTPAVRQKQAAAALRDDPQSSAIDMAAQEITVRARFGAAAFRALVLDYDGTVVSTGGRYDPPSSDIIAQLERLLEGGLSLAFATGRGGSAGEQLRAHLSARHHADVLVGYYNGAYLRPLNVDIRQEPAPRHPAIGEALAWLHARPELFLSSYADSVKDSKVQATIEMSSLRDPKSFSALFESAFAADGRLRLSCSQHSFDICLAETCKTAVISAVANNLGDADASILRIGDSGTRLGNDYAMLGSAYGISVQDVCDRPDVCWSFFGGAIAGPDALLRILRALRFGGAGQVRLVVEDLESGHWS